jgi:hypothetical protein
MGGSTPGAIAMSQSITERSPTEGLETLTSKQCVIMPTDCDCDVSRKQYLCARVNQAPKNTSCFDGRVVGSKLFG